MPDRVEVGRAQGAALGLPVVGVARIVPEQQRHPVEGRQPVLKVWGCGFWLHGVWSVVELSMGAGRAVLPGRTDPVVGASPKPGSPHTLIQITAS